METIEAYLAALSSKDPTPGGGSAATLVGAMAAALVAMVARITAQNPVHAGRADEASNVASEADALREALLAARVADEAAYGRVVAAMALSRDSAAEKAVRRDAVQLALAGAAAAPLRAAELALDTLRVATRAEALGNTHLQSDVDCAFVFANASLAASAFNVRINHAYLKDDALIESQESALGAIERLAAVITAKWSRPGAPP
jgi:formiminotetrahydrofolate cyclodeaminase